MACNCNKVRAVLKCTNCGTLQTINYSASENPLEVAKRAGRKCRKCYGTDFEVK